MTAAPVLADRSSVGRSTSESDDRQIRRLGHVRALDGMRGIAIAAVVAKHFWNVPRGAGFGVDLFFVLSGFLITTLLLEEHERNDAIRLTAFFARRARRLLPALFTMLAVYSVVAVATRPEQVRSTLSSVGLLGFYTANVVLAYFPHLAVRSALGPLWSLAQEEQFYLLWPAVLVLLLRRRLSMAWISKLLVVAVVAVIAERFVLAYGFHVWFKQISFSPESHSDGLLTGALLAVVLRRPRRIDPELAIFAIALLAWIALKDPTLTVAGPMLDFSAAALIAVVVTRPSCLIARGLAWAPLVGLGLISYSLYLWHSPVNYALGGRHLTLAFIGSLAVAYASYRWVEQPFRRRRTSPTSEHRFALARGA